MVFRPFGNETTLPPAAWHPEPTFRGTFSILSTSLLTLLLCVYTVIHTNVPEYEPDRTGQLSPRATKLSRFLPLPSTWRKLGWLVTAVLAPELVVWNALEQRKSVKDLTKEVRQYFGEESWTDSHSWFALMGGFAFDISDAPEPFFPGGRRRLAVTHKGIMAIARYWPHLLLHRPLSVQQIRDKSKADGLAKLLTCWQAAWFCTQCIFRLSSGLSITLLELNVFGHAVCALLIYTLWWNKPKDVQEPHVLDGNDSFEAAATLCTYSPLGRWMIGGYADAKMALPEIFPAAVQLSGPVSMYWTFQPKATDGKVGDINIRVGDAYWTIFSWGHTLDSLNLRALVAKRYIEIDSFAFARLKYGSRQSLEPRSMVQSRCRDWRIDPDLRFGLETRKTLLYSMAVTLANALYGGLHILAFGALYPSPVERLLWRMSSISVAAFGVAVLVYIVLVVVIQKLPSASGDVAALLLGILFCLALLWYIFCRAFLVVECFLSLAHLSESQRAVAAWSQYLPHLS